MYCPKCGTKISNKSRYCKRCGYKLSGKKTNEKRKGFNIDGHIKRSRAIFVLGIITIAFYIYSIMFGLIANSLTGDDQTTLVVISNIFLYASFAIVTPTFILCVINIPMLKNINSSQIKSKFVWISSIVSVCIIAVADILALTFLILISANSRTTPLDQLETFWYLASAMNIIEIIQTAYISIISILSVKWCKKQL